MTKFHIYALLIAAVLFLACEMSGKCSEKLIDHAADLAKMIAVATFAHAQGNRAANKQSEQHEPPGDGK